MNYNEYISLEPYAQNIIEKKKVLSERIRDLTVFHMDNCDEYRRMMESLGFDKESVKKIDGVNLTYEDVPFIPVRLFKELELMSISETDIVKTMTSSGTTGQAVSKIFLNKETAANQQKIMAKIVSDFTGSSRMPMIIIDCPSVIKNRAMFSARGAGILGFSIFGKDKCYALKDEDMSLDFEKVQEFLSNHKGERILLFGFTFMIWQHFYKELLRFSEEGKNIDLSEGILIHGGGWKKLISEAVGHDEFHEKLNKLCKIEHIYDYYGMVEQTGCIYMECDYGHLHASIFSDVIVRNPLDFSICEHGEKGILEVVSSIPESYPGHCLLTEDVGEIIGEDDCPCGRKGKYFKIHGRLKNAEIRGCSDTYGADFK